ncbi:MAG: CapA family protein [Dehalococcoidia bacterium]
MRRDLDMRRPARVTIDAVGDIMLGRDVGRVIAAKGAAYPFEAVRPAMAGADLRFGNLELPLTERGTATNKDYVFRAPPSSAAGLAAAGFNIVSLANNHALDYGAEGLLDTMSALDRAGIRYAGAGRTMDEAHAPALLTVKGIRIALLAYVNVPNDSRTGWVAESSAATATRPGVAWGTAAAVRRDVAAAKAKAEVVVVSIHSGYEYTANPNAIQREPPTPPSTPALRSCSAATRTSFRAWSSIGARRSSIAWATSSSTWMTTTAASRDCPRC